MNKLMPFTNELLNIQINTAIEFFAKFSYKVIFLGGGMTHHTPTPFSCQP